MIAKTNHIRNLANVLVANGSTMSFDQLANNLNANGFTAESGNPYYGARGVARLVDAVYWRLDGQGLLQDRDNVAAAFVNAQGEYAYE